MTKRPWRGLGPWAWALGGVVALVVMLVLVIGPWLLTLHPQHGLTAEQKLKAKNDVRTTLVQAFVGIAVAGGAIVTYRTFRVNREEQDRAYKLLQAGHVNELYAKAVEQIGHDKAAVRLGALYSLERLAWSNPEHRRRVVDVLCAYLRMPYNEPTSDRLLAHQGAAEPSTNENLASATNLGIDLAQELQVRQTIQRILRDHLRPPPGTSAEEAHLIEASPDLVFWPGITLDFTGATLIGDFDLSGITVVSARFGGTTFTGSADFGRVAFTDTAWFPFAKFMGDALFDSVSFARQAVFDQATFTGQAVFKDTRFDGYAWFRGASFIRDVWFDRALIPGRADFSDARVLTFEDAELRWDAHLRLPVGWTVSSDPERPGHYFLVRADKQGELAPLGTPEEPTDR